MKNFKWNSQFETGIKEIDHQHKKIVDFINRLNEAIDSKDSNHKIATILVGFIVYVKTHFKYEEDLFDSYNFDGSAEHKKNHKKLLTQLMDFKELYLQNEKNIDKELLIFLRGWLTVHIQCDDMEFVENVTQGTTK